MTYITDNRAVYSANTLEAAGAVQINTIKGTAMNKDRARVWLEMGQEKLAQFGFLRGERINISLCSDGIIVELAEAGQRKVAGRERGGRTICILDICFDAAQRDAMFNGAAELAVYARHGVLVIKAA